MSYAFSLADMRTYLSYLRTKKQEILFDQAADKADEDEEEGEEDDEDDTVDTDFDPNKKRRVDDMDEDDDTVTTSNDVDTM